ncbi:unnamed protein product [Cyclocybe aegerita]|uniref:Uncharacterized protein n=1 Tax=Cyclocybe aegerita TaxID=1973307 RepID=A0A8S0VSD7_CYCAE|nr:unnamed protein product [Cyclocybe aegerita]
MVPQRFNPSQAPFLCRPRLLRLPRPPQPSLKPPLSLTTRTTSTIDATLLSAPSIYPAPSSDPYDHDIHAVIISIIQIAAPLPTEWPTIPDDVVDPINNAQNVAVSRPTNIDHSSSSPASSSLPPSAGGVDPAKPEPDVPPMRSTDASHLSPHGQTSSPTSPNRSLSTSPDANLASVSTSSTIQTSSPSSSRTLVDDRPRSTSTGANRAEVNTRTRLIAALFVLWLLVP